MSSGPDDDPHNAGHEAITKTNPSGPNEGLQVRVLPGHSDDEKPLGVHNGVAPKT
jgi:hypothetical protein